MICSNNWHMRILQPVSGVAYFQYLGLVQGGESLQWRMSESNKLQAFWARELLVFEQNTEKYKNCNVFRSCDTAILWPQIQLIRNRWPFPTKTSFHQLMLKPIIDETCVFHNKTLSSENVELNWCLLIILYWTNHSWCHCKNYFEKNDVLA